MSSSQTGKITNLKTNEALPFMSNPGQVGLSTFNNYEFNTIAGDQTWVTSYTSSQPRSLSFSIEFNDQIADSAITKKAHDFFENCDQLDTEKRAKPEVEVEFGFIKIKGVLTGVQASYGNFDTTVNPTSVLFSLSITETCENL